MQAGRVGLETTIGNTDDPGSSDLNLDRVTDFTPVSHTKCKTYGPNGLGPNGCLPGRVQGELELHARTRGLRGESNGNGS